MARPLALGFMVTGRSPEKEYHSQDFGIEKRGELLILQNRALKAEQSQRRRKSGIERYLLIVIVRLAGLSQTIGHGQ